MISERPLDSNIGGSFELDRAIDSSWTRTVGTVSIFMYGNGFMKQKTKFSGTKNDTSVQMSVCVRTAKYGNDSK